MKTTDLWFTAFLIYEKGFRLQSVTREGGKGTFYFDMNEEDWFKLKMECGKSNYGKIKRELEEVKDLVY